MAYDLDEKRKLYAAAEIVEYWIVDAMASCIHVFTDPRSNDYATRQIFKVGEQLAPKIAPQAVLQLDDLFNG